MLADPIVNNANKAAKFLDRILDCQKEYLEYLK
jgi:hypothetical protein